VLAALLAAVALAASPAGMETAALPLRGGGWHGSAVVWGAEDGLLLTALHVVEGMPSIDVLLPRGGWVAAEVVDRDPWLDLALLRVAGNLPAALPIGHATEGAPVWLAACPALRCAPAAAEVVAPLRAFAGARYLELRGEARPGASGGAVVDARGALVGIVDLALRRAQPTALAIPASLALARFPRPPR
jgi:S1-C subfamily serine protease